MPTLPTNPHYIGDSSHVNDHNLIVTALASSFFKQSGASSGEASTINMDVKPWNLPWGIVSSAWIATKTSAQTFTSSTLTDVSSLSITATLISGRRYRAAYTLCQVGGTSGERGTVAIVVGGTQTARNYFNLVFHGSNVTSFAIFTGTGSTVIKLQAARDQGSNNMSLWSSSTEPSLLTIEDVGPA